MPFLDTLRRCAIGALLVAVGLSDLGLRPAAAQVPVYTLVDLGPLNATGDATSACADSYGGSATAINAEGQVAGRTGWSDRASAAFRAIDGSVKRLKSGKGGGAGLDINADGQVVGYVTTARADDLCDFAASTSVDRAATWDGSELTELPDDGAERSRATAINDDGVIAGYRQVPDDDPSTPFGVVTVPVVWRDGALEELELPDEADTAVDAEPVDINGEGQIIGRLSAADGSAAGSVLWEDGEASLLPEGFGAVAINDDGVVVGWTQDGDRSTAARLVDGELEELPGLPDDARQSQAYAINGGGDMIGVVAVPGEGDETVYTSVVWLDDEMAEVATLLPTDAGLEPGGLVDINDAGMILGYGNAGDDYHGIVLVPENP